MEQKFVKFESVNLKRAEDIANRFSENEGRVTRAEIILTNKCQLNCVYCQKRLDINEEEERVNHEVLYENLNEWLDNGCRFVHFTGGEATLCEHLPDYVEIAHKKGADITVMCNQYIHKLVHENLADIFIQMGSFNVKPDIYGNKACNLEKVYEAGIPVPKAVFLNGLLLQQFFITDNYDEYNNICENCNQYNKNTAIKEWIIGQEELGILKRLVSELFHNFFEGPYVVRSSANKEDSVDKSYAGIYESVLNVGNEEDMLRAIRTVFASKYNYLDKYPEEGIMGIIIQEQIEADYSGIIFTENPMTGDDELVINYTQGGCEKAVNGRESTEIMVSMDNKIYGECILPGECILELKRLALQVKDIFKAPMDIEWAMKDKNIYILQARPITALKKKIKPGKECFYIDSVDTEQLEKYDMSDIRVPYKKYMEKHYYVRKKAIEAGVRFPETGYLFFSKNVLTNTVFQTLVPESNIYKIVTSEGIRTLSKSNVVTYLNGLGGTDERIARIQRITSTDACGNVKLMSDGLLYIEYIPGGFGGFLTGELAFSRYIVSQEKNIIFKEQLSYEALWEFDENIKKFIRKEKNINHFSLSDNIVHQLTDMAFKMGEVFKNPCIEWELEGNEVYLNDISFDKQDINKENIVEYYLSSGEISGEIRCIPDVNEIRGILKGRSIIAERDFYQAQRSDLLKAFLNKYRIMEDKKYVFVMEYGHPSVSLLLEYSKGFVFEKGGMLSHLAIILRENKIPAKVEKNALGKYGELKFYNGEDVGII